jgi:type IV pilus assembly protein PilA
MLKKIRKSKGGFTLLEVTVVIAILGILMAVATPRFNSVREKAAIAAHNTNVKILTTAATMYLSDNGVPDEDLVWNKEQNSNQWADYIQEWPEVPKKLPDLGDIEKVSNYTVTIKTDGTIEVQPGEIPD